MTILKNDPAETTMAEVVEATSGWRPIADDLGDQIEVILQVHGDRTSVIVVESSNEYPLVNLTADGADALAAELRAFAAAARSIVIDRAVLA